MKYYFTTIPGWKILDRAQVLEAQVFKNFGTLWCKM